MKLNPQLRHRRRSSVLAGVCFLFATTLMMSQTLSAQDGGGQERMFGNGRFLKRIFGSGNSKPKKPDAKSKQLKAKSKQPTPAKRPTAAEPQRSGSAKRPSRNAQPTLATRGTAATPPQRSSADASFGARLPSSNRAGGSNQSPDRNMTNRGQDAPISIPTRSSAQATSGFGMLVELRKEKLFVTRLAPHGNAAKAGLRVGDQLISAGGIDFESLADYNGISEILSGGDQLEFEFRRGSKKNKKLISYGEVPEEGDETIVAPAESLSAASRREDTRPAINRINTQPNNSFLPNSKNVQTRSNRNFSSTRQQSTGLTQAQQTIRAQQQELDRLRQQVNQLKKQPAGDNVGSQLRIPPAAKSVLD